MERHYPVLAQTYRATRDFWNFQGQEPRLTPHGFRFVHPSGAVGLEPEETALFLRLLDRVEVVIDIGANVGWYTLLARAAGKQCIAVEPLDSNLRYLHRNLLENGWQDVEVHPVALSARPGVGLLYGGGTGASLVAGWAESSLGYRTPVALTTLDALAGSRFAGKRLLIKIDAEGSEFHILQGAPCLLAMLPPPLWIVEISLTEHHPGGLNPLYQQTFEFFFSNGYSAWTASLRQPRPVLPDDVSRWVRVPSCGCGGHNFLFRREMQ